MSEFRQIETGGIYHVFNRGVDKRKIFNNNQDYTRFILGLYLFNDVNNKYDIWTSLNFKKQATLNILRPTIGLPGNPIVGRDNQLVEILAFVQMPNHYHLLVRQRQDNGISKFMHKLGGGYSKYFNQQNDRSGVLFQGPYKTVPIKTDAQLTIIFSYIHTNPVELIEPEWKELKVKNKKNAMQYLENYKWSSYRDYIGVPTFPAVIDREFFLDLLGGENECRKYIEDWVSFKAENTVFSDLALD